ncbi:MAG: hypothetical protein M3271_06620, partial [Actinomycetota bacterium]|nr:hypothetical protein [Actinomycetota bacterium]
MNDVHAPERVRCPSCGGLNAPDAEWCGQCLKRFKAPPPPPPPPPAVGDPAPEETQAGAPAAIKPGVERAGFRSTEEGILWRCSSC